MYFRVIQTFYLLFINVVILTLIYQLINGKSDIFVVDNQTRQIYRVSVDSSNGQSNGNSYNPVISGDGLYCI